MIPDSTVSKPGIDLRAASLRSASLAQAVETFIRLELEGQDRAPDTIRWYRDRLDRLAADLGADRPLADVMEIELEEWLAGQSTRRQLYGGGSSRPQTEGKLSAFTLRGYTRALRRFFRWAAKKKLVEINLAAELRMPKKPKIGRKGVSEDDRKAMIEDAAAPLRLRLPEDTSPATETEIRAFRDLAILLFVSSTGCRLGGLANLTLADLRLSDPNPRLARRVSVIEKGEKGRNVYLNAEAFEALAAWLRVRPQGADSRVFVGRKNGATIWKGLSKGGLYGVFKDHAIAAGVKARPDALWSPHQWRHRCGRYMIEQGLDLSRLSQIMGHSTVQITFEHYSQFDDDRLQTAYDQFIDPY
jgi:site-specific recombinase XerD